MKSILIRHIKSSKESIFSESFNIRDLRDLFDGKDIIQELHKHDFYYILALNKGAGNHEIDFTTYEIVNHSVFFMRPDQVHQLTLKEGSTGYILQFKTDMYFPQNKETKDILRKASNKDFSQLDGNRFKRLLTILTYIFEEYTSKTEGYQAIIKANLGLFFLELFRHHQNTKNTTNNINQYYQERLEEFLDLIETNVSSHKHASQYATLLNLSAYRLNAITKITIGKTSTDLINEYTILEIKRWLLATSNQVKQIAYNLGFEDVSYFSRFFKKHTGYTPEVFRNNFKKVLSN